MAHFEVGKKVICIKDHSMGVVKRGDIFELHSIRKSPCGCGAIELDVNIPTPSYAKSVICTRCSTKTLGTPTTWWVRSDRFAPYDDSLSELTSDKLIEQLETELIIAH